jgi:hypothetical protein
MSTPQAESMATASTNTSTPSTSPSSGGQTSNTSNFKSDLSTGVSIGIGVGIGIAALSGVTAIFAWCFLRRVSRSQKQLGRQRNVVVTVIMTSRHM